MLVSTQWLADHLNDDNLRVMDIRGHVIPASEPPPHYFSHRAEYEQDHIPGAVFVDWVRDITDPDSPNGTQIAKPAVYARLMSRLGVGPETMVIAYDDANGMFAARLWWSLHHYGHKQVAVLDGGWDKWIAEDRPVTAAIPEIAPANFTPFPNSAIRRTIEEVATSNAQLLDVRSADEFAGKISRVQRAGHIPGAINLPRKSLLNADGTLQSVDNLHQRFASLDPEREVIVYCNAGVSASYGMLALLQAGFTQVAVYDGSWKEWGSDESRPIE